MDKKKKIEVKTKYITQTIFLATVQMATRAVWIAGDRSDSCYEDILQRMTTLFKKMKTFKLEPSTFKVLQGSLWLKLGQIKKRSAFLLLSSSFQFYPKYSIRLQSLHRWPNLFWFGWCFDPLNGPKMCGSDDWTALQVATVGTSSFS